MPRLKLNISDEELEELPEQFRVMASNTDAMRLVKAMGSLMKTGDLGYWLGTRLMRQLKAFASREYSNAVENVSREVDDTIFFSWLEQVGSIEPNVHWEVESLPNNGGIYKILLQGGQNEKGTHDNQG